MSHPNYLLALQSDSGDEVNGLLTELITFHLNKISPVKKIQYKVSNPTFARESTREAIRRRDDALKAMKTTHNQDNI